MQTRASTSTWILIAVAALLVIVAIGGIAAKISGTQSESQAVHPVNVAAESFPVPSGATVSLPPANGTNPPSTVRSWKAIGTLDESCSQWRELFRGWIDQTAQNQVGGDTFPGSSCSFTGMKNGFDAVLRIASYAGAPPEATLIVTDKTTTSTTSGP